MHDDPPVGRKCTHGAALYPRLQRAGASSEPMGTVCVCPAIPSGIPLSMRRDDADWRPPAEAVAAMSRPAAAAGLRIAGLWVGGPRDQQVRPPRRADELRTRRPALTRTVRATCHRGRGSSPPDAERASERSERCERSVSRAWGIQGLPARASEFSGSSVSWRSQRPCSCSAVRSTRHRCEHRPLGRCGHFRPSLVGRCFMSAGFSFSSFIPAVMHYSGGGG